MAKEELLRWEATEKIRLEEEGIREAEEDRNKEIKHLRLMARLKAHLLDVSIIFYFDFATKPLPDPESEVEEIEIEDYLLEEGGEGLEEEEVEFKTESSLQQIEEGIEQEEEEEEVFSI